MCKSKNKIFFISFIIIISLSFYIISSLVIIDHSTLPDQTLPIKTKNITPPMIGSRATFPDRIINGDRIVKYSEDLILGNLTIRQTATLNVENCNLEIRGKLSVMENGRLFIKNSNITISPGPVSPQEIIINFSDSAKIRIEKTNLYTFPQPTLTNISYLLSDDDSEVTIIDSYMNCKLPAVLNMDIELTPPTAGTFILTGNTIWNIYNTKIEGFLRINEDDMLIGRWFLFTLQQNAQLYMKNCYGYMNDSSQPFIKPIAGYLKVEDCRVIHGVIDVEVVAEFEAINLTIEEINLRDQTKSKIIRSNIEDNVDSGSVAIVPSAVGSTTLLEKPKNKPKTVLYAEDTKIGQKIIAQGNSSNELVNCDLGACIIFSDGSVILDRSEVETVAEVKENGSLIIKNSTAYNINVGGNSFVGIYQNPSSHSINKLTTGFNCQSEIVLQETKMNLFEVYGGDQILPPYGPDYQPDRNRSSITIRMFDSNISNLKTEDDSEIYITLKNSEITNFLFKPVKKESVKITILDLGGIYNIPEPWPEVNLEFDIYHQLSIYAQVNEYPVESRVVIENQQNDLKYTIFTDELGFAKLDLHFQNIKNNISILTGDYTVIVDYLGLSDSFTTSAGINEELKASWSDNSPPTISNIIIDSSYHITKRPTRVRATIFDADVKVIANATIFYRYSASTSNGWSKWFTSSMLEVENNTFEGEIRDKPDGTSIEFYIVSYDILGNKKVSESRTYLLENPDVIIYIMILMFLIILILIFLIYLFNKRTKLKKYMDKKKNIEQRVSNEKFKK